MLCRTPRFTTADLQNLRVLYRCHWTSWMTRTVGPIVTRGGTTPEILAAVVGTTDSLQILSDCLAIWEFQHRVLGKPESIAVMAPLVHQAFLTLAQQSYEPSTPVSGDLQQTFDDLREAQVALVAKLESAPAVDTATLATPENQAPPPSGFLN